MWQFRSPNIVFGEDALQRLVDLPGSRAAVITDANIQALGYVQLVEAQLAAKGFAVRVFAEVEPEPAIEMVYRAADALHDFQPDVVIGLGGGSCLDVAKVAWFLYERPDLGLEDITPFVDYELGSSHLVAISTTSGTGSDITIGAVLTDQERRQKLSFYSQQIMPELAIIDPSLVMGLPAQVTADTGMDIVSHAVEAFAGPYHNDFTDGLCLQAMALTLEYLPRAYANGGDAEAREHLHNAASIAGLAMTNSSVSLAHALAHSLGAAFEVPHGRAVGLLLPYSIEYTANGGGTRYAKMAHFLHLEAGDEAAGTASLVAVIRKLARRIGQPLIVQALGIERDDYEAAMPDLVANAAADTQMLTTLRVPDDDELERLFWYAYEGKRIDF